MTGSFTQNFYDFNSLKATFRSQCNITIALSQCSQLPVTQYYCNFELRRSQCLLSSVSSLVLNECGFRIVTKCEGGGGVEVHGYSGFPSHFWTTILP